VTAARTAAAKRDPIVIGELTVAAGRSGTGEIPVARLVTGTKISLPVQIVHGKTEGPTIWLSAAVHGDEIAGVEIIRRVLREINPQEIAGTIITVPIVNVHGFLTGDRYLPDRRDLNRSFPGSAGGSLASRIANLFMAEIVSRCDVGIDLHTGSDHRVNLGHIRADLDDEPTRRLAEAFGAPIMLHARVRDGSLRGAATEKGCTVLLFEGGEAWRFDKDAIEMGVSGIRRVLVELGMIEASDAGVGQVPTACRKSTWIRARRSGIVSVETQLGDRVVKRQQLGVIYDSVGKRVSRVSAPSAGIVIGYIQHPLVNQGDAVVHIALEADK
jgi:uncharacterized protein